MADNRQERVYIGKVREGKFPGALVISLGPDDFEKLQAARNEKGWVNLWYSACREPTPEKPGYMTLPPPKCQDGGAVQTELKVRPSAEQPARPASRPAAPVPAPAHTQPVDDAGDDDNLPF